MEWIKNTYEKFVAWLLCIVSVIGLALGIKRLSSDGQISIIGGEDGPTAVYLAGKKPFQSVLKSIASGAVLVAAIATLLLSFVKYCSGKE